MRTLGTWMLILLAPSLMACSDNAATAGFMDSAWAQSPPADARTDAWLETVRVAGLAKPEAFGAIHELAAPTPRVANTHPSLLRGPFVSEQPLPALPAHNDSQHFASL